MLDLFARTTDEPTVQPWRPRPLDHASWPPDYRGVFAWRIKTLTALRADPALRASARAYYRTHKAEFICDWCDTYNPRKPMKWAPFVLFKRQAEFVQFIEELLRDQENGLVEKCRDIGATWLAAAYSVACFLFDDDTAIGWGSRKQELVDKLGDPDSIFEKMRLLLRRLPDVFMPDGWRPRDHATFMKLLNPENGSSVTGESGDNIGRGGRKSAYWKDESAHYERPEKIEAALGDNTNVQIDISSVNGLGNVFHRRAESAVVWAPGIDAPAGMVRKFIFDWRDHPEKTQEWYDRRKAVAEREGLQHIFAQEVDRNYAAAVQNTIIAYEWIVAAIDAHLKIPYLASVPVPNVWSAGLDVADGGLDRNALSLRQWIILRSVEEWGERDPGVTMRRTIAALRGKPPMKIQADLIGVGSGVKTEYNRLIDDGLIERQMIDLVFWNAGGAVVNPGERSIPGDDESPYNRDMFGNFKAQAWWSLRARFYKTWRVIEAMKAGEDLPIYSPDELIALDSASLGEKLMPLCKELAQPVRGTSSGLRTIVDKSPPGTRSPNMADSVVQSYFPVPDTGGQPIVGSMRT